MLMEGNVKVKVVLRKVFLIAGYIIYSRISCNDFLFQYRPWIT